MISGFSLWEQHNEAIKAGYDKLHNENTEQFAADRDAKIRENREHISVRLQKARLRQYEKCMIKKDDVTPSNVTGADDAALVLPGSGVFFTDKGYVGAIDEIKRRFLILIVILRDNMADKDRERDKWVSKKRALFERTFSKQARRERYRGMAKNRAAEFLYAAAHNMRRLLVSA